MDPKVYIKAGVNTFKDYVALAEERGIVTLHIGSPGKESISLCDPLLSQHSRTQSHASPTLSSSTSIVSYTVAERQRLATRQKFAPLIQVLRKHREKFGSTQPLNAAVGEDLRLLDPNVYKKAGVARLKEYVDMAEASGIARNVLLKGAVMGQERIELIE